MAAGNGDSGREGGPTPEQIAAQAAEQVPEGAIPISTKITRRSKATSAERQPDGSIEVAFIVLNGPEVQQHAFIVGEPGKKALLDALTGGLTLPGQ